MSAALQLTPGTSPEQASRFDVTFYAGGATDTRPQGRGVTWERLAEWLTTFDVYREDTQKERVPFWSPVRIRQGGHRCNEDVEWVSLLVLDFDDGKVEPEEASAAFGDVPHALHTTWSHSAEKSKIRLIVPLAEPVPGEDWKPAWEWSRIARVTGASSDRSCKDASRAYVKPALRAADSPRVAWVHDPGSPFWRLDYHDYARQCRDSEERERERRREWGRRMREHVRPGRETQALRRLMREDPETRLQAAHRLGAQIVRTAQGEIARGIRCPACGRPDVWFLLHPERMKGAVCNHRKSCGWGASLFDLCAANLGGANG